MAACGPERFGALADGLGLDARAVPPRIVFLTGLSTVGTYCGTWELALRFSDGAVREALSGIRQIENSVNALARHAFPAAAHYYRGESVPETTGVRSRAAGPAWHYSYVSLSSGPAAAPGLTARERRRPGGAKVVLVIDARTVQRLGIFLAVCSMASDVLGLTREEESTGRTFPVRLGHELQAHFCDQWPPGSEEAMVAVLTGAPLSPGDRGRLEETGLPVLDAGAVIPL